MKKVFALVAIAASVALFSCNNTTEENNTDGTDTTVTTPAPETAPMDTNTAPMDTNHMGGDTMKKM